MSAPLPILDFGDASCSTAQATYMAALHRATRTTVDASLQVRENYGACRIPRHSPAYRDEMVPLRKTISEEMAHRNNG